MSRPGSYYVQTTAVLARKPAAVLRRLRSDGKRDWLVRRLAAIALDMQGHPQRYDDIARYKQSAAELAAAEDRPIGSRTAVNHPPELKPEHGTEEYRLAWESHLMGTDWWQAKEMGALVLRDLGAVASVPVLGLELRKAMVTFNHSTDKGWQYRAIMALALALASTHDARALAELAAAYAAGTDRGARDYLVVIVRDDAGWKTIVSQARRDRLMQTHRNFLDRCVT